MVISKKKPDPAARGLKSKTPSKPQNPKTPKSPFQGSKLQTPRIIAWRAERRGGRSGDTALPCSG
jgi:hypothetical protein